MKTIKLGNICFTIQNFDNVSFDEFNATYAGMLRGIDIKKAYDTIQANIIKVPVKKVKSEKVRKSVRKTKKV